MRASILVGERRWNLRLKNGLDVRLPEDDVASALERLVALDRDAKLMSRDIVAIDLRLPDRVTVRLSRRRAGARGRAQGEEAGQEGGGMSALQFGLTPKTKPLSPKRSALVAALDVGTSKIACLIARLKPQAPQDVLRRRSHTVEVLGFGHTLARGMKAGAVVDLADAEAAIRQAFDLAERSAKMQLESVVVSVSAGKPGSELISASVDVAGAAVSDGDIARVLAAGSRHSVRDGRAVLHSLPIGYALDEATGIRDPRGMLGRRFGIDMHVVTADVAVARNLMLAVERCHLDVEAMVAGPYAAGLSALADDEADLGAALIDMGAGTTDDRGLRRRPFRPRRRLCARRPARHHGSRARPQRAHRRRRAHQDALRQRACRAAPTSAT